MINDPAQWAQQTWNVPWDVQVQRDGDKWYITPLLGFRIEIDPKWGERLVQQIVTHHIKYAFDGEDPRERQ